MGIKPASESGWQDVVARRAQLSGWKVVHLRKSLVPTKGGGFRWLTNAAYDGKGFFDLVLVRDGVLVFAELKSEGGRLSAEQKMWYEIMKEVADASDGVVSVYRWEPSDWDEVVRILK